jgi:hypothetical protein
MGFGLAALEAFVAEHAGATRESLVAGGHLRPEAPAKATALLGSADRTEDGDALLTLALPRFKAGALDFMRASTELAAAGTWQDPDSVSSDERADNVPTEVQYGEVEGELVGHGIVLALTLINKLEVNEQVLYARMINVEETSLII